MEVTMIVNTTDGRKVTISGHPDDVDRIVEMMQLIGPDMDLEVLRGLSFLLEREREILSK